MKPLKQTIDNETVYKVVRNDINAEYVDKLMFTTEMYRIRNCLKQLIIRKCSQNDYSVSK